LNVFKPHIDHTWPCISCYIYSNSLELVGVTIFKFVKNIGATRAGGVIFSLGGNQEIIFSWSLGKATNNQVKAYSLLQGIILARKHEFNYLIILGYLKVTIIHVHKHFLQDIKIQNILIKIRK
jgi:hypothetical protein